MQIFDNEALIDCIQDAVREEIQITMKDMYINLVKKENDKLFTKKEMAEELDISLVMLTDWMKKGLPFLRLNKRVYFKKEEVIKAMTQHSSR